MWPPPGWCFAVKPGLVWSSSPAVLSARAVIVTYDKDLLDLGKPYGVEILRPSAFLKRFTA
jgi:hypothetical protein